jgi:lysozyme
VLYQDQIALPVARVGPAANAATIRKEYPLRQEHNRVWSKGEINQLFAADIGAFERGVLRLVPSCDGSQGAFDAIVSLAYNIGLGNLQRSQVRIRANRRDWEGAAEAMLAWSKAGGRVLPGLLKRRQAEAALMIA